MVTINQNLDEQVKGQYCLFVPFQNNINCHLPFTTQINAIVILFALNCSLGPENGQPQFFKDLACVKQSHNKKIVVQLSNDYFSANRQ
ncbi:hypothetical protein P8452_77195 [Trifolium repens]|nr:hypothetical protein P8452_77195 [Trifolium repens]